MFVQLTKDHLGRKAGERLDVGETDAGQLLTTGTAVPVPDDVITPLVSESDKLEVKSAEAEAERLAREVFPDLRVDVLHGRIG